MISYQLLPVSFDVGTTSNNAKDLAGRLSVLRREYSFFATARERFSMYGQKAKDLVRCNSIVFTHYYF